MKRPIKALVTLAAVSFAIAFVFISINAGGSASAAEPVQFNVNASMADNLTLLKGKSVTVYLASGQTITGTVEEAKGNLLHLVKLSQKDFFDALVAIDRISAIDTRVRGQ